MWFLYNYTGTTVRSCTSFTPEIKSGCKHFIGSVFYQAQQWSSVEAVPFLVHAIQEEPDGDSGKINLYSIL